MTPLASGAGFARLADFEPPDPSERRVLLRRGRLRRPYRMRLRFTPWWPAAGPRTLVELLPDGKVTPGERYFDAGHRLLDEVICAGG